MVITVLQINASENPDANLEKTNKLLQKALKKSPEVIVLPEYTNYMGPLSSAHEKSETENGPWIKMLSGFAAQYHVEIIAGLLIRGENKKSRSELFYFNQSGEISGRYTKLHLFDIDLRKGPRIKESDFLQPGSRTGMAMVSGMTSGFTICYDLRFPELFRKLRSDGAGLIYNVSAFTEQTGRAHWDVLLKARAIENQAYLIAANQVGPYKNDKCSYGHSMIIDPWGTVLCEAPGPEDREPETVIWADIDPALVEKTRKEMPCHEHRRKDLFNA